MSTAPCANSAYVAPAPSPMIRNCTNDCTSFAFQVHAAFSLRALHHGPQWVLPHGPRRRLAPGCSCLHEALHRSALRLGSAEDRPAQHLVEADLRLLDEVALEPAGRLRLRIP